MGLVKWVGRKINFLMPWEVDHMLINVDPENPHPRLQPNSMDRYTWERFEKYESNLEENEKGRLQKEFNDLWKLLFKADLFNEKGEFKARGSKTVYSTVPSQDVHSAIVDEIIKRVLIKAFRDVKTKSNREEVLLSERRKKLKEKLERFLLMLWKYEAKDNQEMELKFQKNDQKSRDEKRNKWVDDHVITWKVERDGKFMQHYDKRKLAAQKYFFSGFMSHFQIWNFFR